MKKLLQKMGAVLLAAAAVLSPAAGTGCVSMKNTEVLAADKKITIKAASDFTLEFPADWKKQYVKKASKNKGHSSYVAFYSKSAIRKQRKGGCFPLQGTKMALI